MCIPSMCYAFPENLIRQTILSNFPALRSKIIIVLQIDLVRYDRSTRMLDNNIITILGRDRHNCNIINVTIVLSVQRIV